MVESPDDDETALNDVIQAASQTEDTSAIKSPPDDTSPPSPSQESASIASNKSRHPGRQASVSIQSKLRSTSFRDAAPGPTSPSVGTLQRVEDLERENRRLAQEAAEHESRWRNMEEELEELREDNVSNQGNEMDKLKTEIETLRRQQRQGSTSGQGKGSRRDSVSAEDTDTLRKEIESKDSTIADMQLEISRLRSQLSSQSQGCEAHGEQIDALQTSLQTVESKARKLEKELGDTKKSLARASEKAMLDGTERTSKDTKIRNLERDMTDAVTKRDETVKKAEQLEKKVEAMNKLHREAEARSASKLSAAEQASREVPSLRAKTERLESEMTRLREKHKRSMSGGGADDALDELEDEERTKLEKRIRELEGQVFDLQRGVWRDKRTSLQPDITGSGGNADEGDFDEVDLTGTSGATLRRPSALQRTTSPGQKHSNFSQYFTSGLNAFLPSTTSPPPGARPRNDSLLEEFPEDEAGFDEAGFDEAAFAQAQREEEAKKMLEHVREVKRGLKQWKGWRLDLVDARRAEGGQWEIFEV